MTDTTPTDGSPQPRNAPSIEDQVEMLRKMVLVRTMEEELGRLHKAGKTRGPIHRCDGQEAVGIGATAALLPEDVVTSTHRGHAHYLGKGLDPKGVAAEIMGRATGLCGGRAGHMLVADKTHGVLGGNAIVGASIPAATGMAVSFQLTGASSIALAFFGDGAAQTGICHESMNLAGLWRLPVVFVCEHNQYGLTVPARQQSSVQDLAVRAAGYGMDGVIVDGNDALAGYDAVAEAAARARRGDGPTLIEAKTYRMVGFSTSDVGGYQPAEEMDAWRSRDPIDRLADALAPQVGRDRLDSVAAAAREEMEEAFRSAMNDPAPDTPLVVEPTYADAEARTAP
ncbi:MAG: thiamine pyrophosphate-dependent dehydrogenase E1 component subunit alpha [Pseudomonadota bacterium]